MLVGKPDIGGISGFFAGWLFGGCGEGTASRGGGFLLGRGNAAMN